jgi:hypothetical protein
LKQKDLVVKEVCREITKEKKGRSLSHESQKKVLQFYHADSTTQESPSIVENSTYLSAVDDLIDLSVGSCVSGIYSAANNVRQQAKQLSTLKCQILQEHFMTSNYGTQAILRT